MKTILLCLSFCCVSCTTINILNNPKILVSVKDQKLSLLNDNRTVKTYPISTGRGGVGSKPGSNQTPLGLFKIKEKIGEGLPISTGFRANIPTNHVWGCDPIVSRVLVIEGLEKQNRNTLDRKCKIHGTPYISQLGKACSMGCIRLSPETIAELSALISVGTLLEIHL